MEGERVDTFKIGLIPSPDLPAKIVSKIMTHLKKDLYTHVDATIDWQFDIKVDPLIGAAENVNEYVEKAEGMLEKNGWDYAICITDLPSFSEHKVVVANVSTKRGAALISLPAFGAFPLKKRIRKAVTFITELFWLNQDKQEEEEIVTRMRWNFLFTKVKRVIPEEDMHTNVRFILQSKVIGWLRVLVAMVYANRPWKALTSFNKILTLAFATGTYIAIFSTSWKLSVAFTVPRFILLMLLSITGMVLWITFAHNLWEKSSSTSQSQYRVLYNVTTTLTLMVITLITYVLLFVLFMFSISLFVPQALFETWTNADGRNTIEHFLGLTWFITSLGLLAGAVGVTSEKEEKIRRLTYSYRQLYRYYEIEQNEETKSSTEEAEQETDEQTKQSHREDDPQ